MIQGSRQALRRLFGSLQRTWDRIVKRRSLYSLAETEDLPDRLARRMLYLVGEPGYPLHASMACPRGRCSTILNMNLAPDEQPQWSLQTDVNGRPTLTPSVWERTTCGCHFVLRNGRVEWCKNQ